MEPRFGHDFSRVRVHADLNAARSAEAVGAQAYTVGSSVAFAFGRYAPASRDGQRLLAHELAYVVQQRGSSPQIQRKPDPQRKSGVRFGYSVSVATLLDSDQLLLEFIKQYRGVTTDAEAAVVRKTEEWHWVQPRRVKQSDVDKGYVLISVDDLSVSTGTGEEKKERGEYFKGLSQTQRAAINIEKTASSGRRPNTASVTHSAQRPTTRRWQSTGKYFATNSSGSGRQ